MFHFITLFTVAVNAEDDFVRQLGIGGTWYEQARRVAPALVGADLLRHQRQPMFLCHDIWTTPEAYAHARGNQAVQKLFDTRKQMSAYCFEIGPFAFPALKETAGTVNASLTLGDASSPVGWFSTERLEDELFDAIIQDTIDNPTTTTAALAQIDAHFAKDGEDRESHHRQSMLGLLRLLRPNLAELLREPSSPK